MKSSKVLNVILDYFLMTVGSVIFCMAWTSFLIPNGLASGGLTGLCTIIQYGTGIPVGLTYPIINVILLILGFLSLGKAFGFKTIYVIALTSLLFDLLPKFPQLEIDRIHRASRRLDAGQISLGLQLQCQLDRMVHRVRLVPEASVCPAGAGRGNDSSRAPVLLHRIRPSGIRRTGIRNRLRMGNGHA